ncbi:MAG: hypothetical protein ACJ703_08210, partial [Nitrososphaera sp.]
ACHDTLLSCKREGRWGITVFDDVGSFFSFDRIEDMVELELQCPRKYGYQMSGIFFLSCQGF